MPELIGLYRAAGVELAHIGAGGDAFPKHTHGEYVISAMLAGCEQVWLDGKRFEVQPGDVTVYNPEAVQASEFLPQAGRAEFVSLYLPPERLQRCADENELAGAVQAPPIVQPVIRDGALFATLRALGHAAHGGNEGELAALLEELMGGLLVAYAALPAAPRWPRWPDCPLAPLTDYMRANLGRALTLDELSQLAGIGKFHLVRAFRARFGLTPIKYHMQLRLREARRLLRLGTPVLDVAHRLGFYDQSHFANAFRRVVGGTPQQYRRAGRY